MYKFSVTKQINHGNVIYGMMTIDNNTVFHIWKLLKVNLKNSPHKQKIVPIWWWMLTGLTVVIISQ